MAYGNKVMSVRVNKKGNILILSVGEVTGDSVGSCYHLPTLGTARAGWWGEVEKTVLRSCAVQEDHTKRSADSPQPGV